MPIAEAPVAHAAAVSRAERAIVRQVNAVRAYAGLPRLRLTVRLSRHADRHNRAMSGAGRLSHDAGSSFSSRAGRMPYRRMGETLAWMPRGRSSAQRVVRAWLNSPGHRAVLLNGSFRRIGVGRRTARINGHRGVLVTAEFASLR